MDAQDRELLAKQLKNNPLLEEIFRDGKQAAFDRWRVAPGVEQRELCWLQFQALESLETQTAAILSNIIDNATLRGGS